MKKIKSVYAKVATLSFVLLLMHGFANAQCTTQIYNYAPCSPKFLSISSDNCQSNPYGGYTSYTITVTVSEPAASYTATGLNNATVTSAHTTGTTLIYTIQTLPKTASTGLMVTMGGSCNNSNMIRIDIN
jgi:hypothetical protein